MRPSTILPFLALALLLLAACSSSGSRSLSADERAKLLEIHTESAQQYLNMGDLDRAEGQVEKGLALEQDHRQLRLILGKTLLKRGGANDLLRAEKVFRSLGDGDFQVEVGLGATLERLAVLHRESAVAIRDGRRLTQAADPEARTRELESQAQTYLVEAQACFTRSLEHKQDNIDGLNGLVRVYALRGERERSLEQAEKLAHLLREDRRFWEASLLRPEISADEEARFRKLARAQSEIEIATRLHASVLLHELGREAPAIVHLDGVIELKPELAEAYSRRAESRMQLGQYQEANADLEAFLRLSRGKKSDDPEIKRAYSLMSECMRKLREPAGQRG